MNLEKRKEYFMLTSIIFIIGFLLFGFTATCNSEVLEIPFNKFLVFLIYGLAGGVLVGGIMSGILISAQIIRRQKLIIKIILSIFFPITLILICYIGIFAVIPYGIYNFILLRKRNTTEQEN